jgi:hypothetical protein
LGFIALPDGSALTGATPNETTSVSGGESGIESAD